VVGDTRPIHTFRPNRNGVSLEGMTTPAAGKLIRDPLWDTIHLDPTAVRIVDTAEFQRLRYIRQLGLAHLDRLRSRGRIS